MPNYRRPAFSPSPVFFTVCLADRSSTALLDHLDVLREAVRVVLKDRPFDILAWVVLPDHMHAVWRLPYADLPSPHELLVLHPLRLQRVGSEAPFLVFLVILEVALEPFDMRLALEGEDVGAEPVEEEPVVAR
jgi:hypothetical protein